MKAHDEQIQTYGGEKEYGASLGIAVKNGEETALRT